MKYYLAIDIGASSGRHILGWLEDGILQLEEVYRFQNGMAKKNGHLCWDDKHIFREIVRGMKKCKEIGKCPVSVAIDTWGVDFRLLDGNDEPLGDFIGYRDHRTDGVRELLDPVISQRELYEKTGIQFQPYNTLNQLAALKFDAPETLTAAKTMLMTPDYFNFLLTGKKMQEITIASTTQMLSLDGTEWNKPIIERVGIPSDMLLSPNFPGTVVGEIKAEIAEEIGYSCNVIMAAEHDTASAVMAVPSIDDDALYISSGTWSLMGCCSGRGNNGVEAMHDGFTNERGYGNQYRFLKNIMGLWMIQSVKKEIAADKSFAEICELAEKETISSIVDCNDTCFLSPTSMVKAVQDYCSDSNQQVPQTLGEIACVIYNSLARCYAEAKCQIEALTGLHFDTIYIIGGGSNAAYLNKLTAKYANCKVSAGPGEATAIGNILCQMLRFGMFSDLREARKCVIDSFSVKLFH